MCCEAFVVLIAGEGRIHHMEVKPIHVWSFFLVHPPKTPNKKLHKLPETYPSMPLEEIECYLTISGPVCFKC